MDYKTDIDKLRHSCSHVMAQTNLKEAVMKAGNGKGFFLKLLFIAAILLFVTSIGFAETVYFKNGKVRNVNIIERTDRYIKVEALGSPITYNMEDIKAIEGDRAAPSVLVEPKSVKALQQPHEDTGIYVNKEFGFTIIPPKGWIKNREGNFRGRFVISYDKYKEDPSMVMNLPNFGIMVSPLPFPAKNPLEVANKMFSQWKSVEEKYEIAESPKEFEANGIKGAMFGWYKPAWDKFKNQEFWVRILSVYFIKEQKLYTITMFSRRDRHEGDYKEIEPTLKSFRFLDQPKSEVDASKPVSLGGTYTSEDHGFMITAPSGWIKQEDWHGTLVQFSKEGQQLPILGITADDVSKDPTIKTALDFTKKISGQYKQSPNIMIWEEPKEITLNNIKGSTFTFGPKNTELKTLFEQFLLGKNIITLIAMYEQSSQLGELKTIINTFKLVDISDSFVKLEQLVGLGTQFKPINDADYVILRDQIIKRINMINSLKARYVIKVISDDKLANNDLKELEFKMTFLSPTEFEVEQALYAQGVGDTWRVVGDKIYIKIGFWMENPDVSKDPKADPQLVKMMRNRKNIYKVLSIKKYSELLSKEKPIGVYEDQKNGYIVLGFELKNTDYLALDMFSEKLIKPKISLWVDQKDNTPRFVKLTFEEDQGGKLTKQQHEHYFTAFNEKFTLGTPDVIIRR